MLTQQSDSGMHNKRSHSLFNAVGCWCCGYAGGESKVTQSTQEDCIAKQTPAAAAAAVPISFKRQQPRQRAVT
jgi:hypothetical protein